MSKLGSYYEATSLDHLISKVDKAMTEISNLITKSLVENEGSVHL